MLGIAGGLAAAWALMVAVLWLVRPKDAKLGTLVSVVPDALRLARGLLTDRTVPLGVRAAVLGLVVWLINPIDLIPEFIPVLGPLDDIVVAVLVFRYVRRRLGEDRMRSRWPGTTAGYEAFSRVLGQREGASG